MSHGTVYINLADITLPDGKADTAFLDRLFDMGITVKLEK